MSQLSERQRRAPPIKTLRPPGVPRRAGAHVLTFRRGRPRVLHDARASLSTASPGAGEAESSGGAAVPSPWIGWRVMARDLGGR